MNPDKSRSLLIVEDDPNDVFFIRRGLNKVGVGDHVQIVRDGGEAVAYLEGGGRYQERTVYPLPALVLLDLKMPKKSGLEVLEWIRNDVRFRDLPVVILTSSKQPGDIARSRELGVAAYHVKPVDYNDFVLLTRSIGRLWNNLSNQSVPR